MMDDLISRQDAIDVFGDVSPLDHNANAYREKIKNLPSVGKAANAITIELSPEQIKKCVENAIVDIVPFEPQWIPCSERLPEEGQKVLFSTKTGTVQIGKYSDRSCLNSWFSYCDKCRAWNNVVNAWMPLPEPYKGEEK